MLTFVAVYLSNSNKSNGIVWVLVEWFLSSWFGEKVDVADVVVLLRWRDCCRIKLTGGIGD